MPRRRKIALIVFAALMLATGVSVFLLSRVDVRSRVEASGSAATGLQFAVKGGVSIGLFPDPHVRLRDVTLSNDKSQIASLGEAEVGVALWPLLFKQVRITRISLRNAIIEVVRDRHGHLNFVASRNGLAQKRSVPAMDPRSVSLAKVSFRYTNRKTAKEIQVIDCRFDSDDFRLIEGSSEDILKHLSLSTRVECAQMRNDLFVGSDVQFPVSGDRGVFKLTPVTMQIMGGKGAGSIDADFSGEMPVYRVHYAVTQLRVENLFKSLARGKAGTGYMDFTTDLSMRGWNAAQLTRTADGEASLRGKDLDIAIGDLDEKLAHYESSQNFNLVDVGAFFIAGPLGVVVTKGYNFASIFQGTGGSTHIRRLVSTWKVENGVAHAQDVAMATKENRVAMKGALDFVNKDFDDVTVAILDGKGCARVEQRIRGSFSKPVIDKPNVIASLAGPISRLIDKTKKMLGAKCTVFYEGSVQP